MCSFLISQGANINIQDNNKNTPLYWAKKSNKLQVVDLLISFGAILLQEP